MKCLLIAVVAAGFLACAGVSDHDGPREHQSGHPGAHPGGHADPGHGHDFSDVERFARVFDDPARAAWQRPDEVVAMLDVKPGATVADLGAGTGYFVPRLAEAAGPAGRVLALDVEPKMVEYMRARFRAAGLENAEARVVRPDSPGLGAASVDRILVVDTWHHISERERYAKRLREVLRSGGAVLVVDFTADSPHGPPASMRLTANEVAAELGAGGLEVEVLEESLPWQYAVRGRVSK